MGQCSPMNCQSMQKPWRSGHRKKTDNLEEKDVSSNPFLNPKFVFMQMFEEVGDTIQDPDKTALIFDPPLGLQAYLAKAKKKNQRS